MSARMEVIHVINKFQPKSFVEVGVWRGDLLQLILENCLSVNRFIAIDPWRASLNIFDYKGDDIPTKNQKAKRYTCTMSEKPKSQPELDEMYSEVVRRFAPLGEKFTVLRATSHRASKLFQDGIFDFIYIDALHLYDAVKEDIGLWTPKVKMGGVLAGDDYDKGFPGVMKAIDEVLPAASHHGRVWFAQRSKDTKHSETNSGSVARFFKECPSDD